MALQSGRGQYGPVDEAEIIRLIRSGELPAGTPVCKEGDTDWQPAREHACFQVEIYPKKKRAPVKAAASTTPKTVPAGATQSKGATTGKPAATAPNATTGVLQRKLAFAWVVAGILGVAVLYLSFKPAPRGEDFADAPQSTGAGGPPPSPPKKVPPSPPPKKVTPSPPPKKVTPSPPPQKSTPTPPAVNPVLTAQQADIVKDALCLSLKIPSGKFAPPVNLTQADYERATFLQFQGTQLTDVGLKEVAKCKNLRLLSPRWVG